MNPWKQIELRGEPFLIHANNELLSAAIERDKDFYEAEILDYLKEQHLGHDLIVDVGANIGNHTIFFGRYLSYDTIMAFEPDYQNYLVLTNNIAVNKIDFRFIIPINIALSDFTGQAGLVKNSVNYGAHEIHKEVKENTVPCYPLDAFMFENVTLLKIDAELHEPEILAGAKETIQRCKPLILIEDTFQVYAALLPNYRLLKAWPEYKTYLYESEK